MSAKKKRKATVEEIKRALPIPALHTRCPHCGHDMKLGSWAAAHLDIELSATCEECSKQYLIEAYAFDKVEEGHGVMGEPA